MMNKRHWFLATAGILAVSLWVGSAAADESSTGSSAADSLSVDQENALDTQHMLAVSGDHGVSLGASSTANAGVNGNDMSGATVETGDVLSMQNNSGGINVNMVNSGNNVIMQNSMPVNIYLSPQQ